MKYPEKFRVQASLNQMLNCFSIPFEGRELKVIASNWGKWQHVSVSLNNRCPNWREMSYVKDLFWENEEECVQFHPKKSEYVNFHQYCLHIWKVPEEAAELLNKRIEDINSWLEEVNK